MNNEIEIKVNTKIEVSDETAMVCLHMLQLFCKNKREDLEPGLACKGCVFLNRIYCEYRQMPVCAEKVVEECGAESEDKTE